ELTRFFVFRHHGSNACGCEECRDTGSSGADTFRKRSLRNKFEFDLAFENFFFQQLVFADVSADVLAQLSRREQQSDAESVYAGVIADRGEILRAFLDQRANQV